MLPPPWNPDYGALAPREAVANNPNGLNLFLTPESVVLGEGSTFQSLSGSSPTLAGATFENCVVMFDDVEPSGISLGTGSNGPPRIDDLRGTHPTIAGGGTITLDVTQDVTWGGAQTVADAVYIGSCSSIGNGTDLMAQSYRGRGFVRAIDSNANRPERNYTVNTVGTESFYPGRLPGMAVGDDEIIPSFATRVEVSASITVNGGVGAVRLQLASSLGFGAPQPFASPLGRTTIARMNNGADMPGGGLFGNEAVAIERDNSGACGVQFEGGPGIASSTLVFTGFEDPLLASR